MNIPLEQLNTVYEIMRDAEISILALTGVNIKLKAVGGEIRPPKECIKLVAQVLGMSLGDYYLPHRKVEYIDLRCLAAHFLQKHYTQLRQTEIANLVGCRDHSSISHYRQRHNDSLDTKEEEYTRKYNEVKAAVEKWMTEH